MGSVDDPDEGKTHFESLSLSFRFSGVSPLGCDKGTADGRVFVWERSPGTRKEAALMMRQTNSAPSRSFRRIRLFPLRSFASHEERDAI